MAVNLDDDNLDGADEPVATTEPKDKKPVGGLKDLAGKLYSGDAGVDVVGKSKIFFAVAAAIVIISALAIFVRPFNFGIEFRGGNSFTVPGTAGTLEEVRGTVEEAGAEVASAQVVTFDTGSSYLIKTPVLDPDPVVATAEATEIKQKLADRFNIPLDQISDNAVSGAWGATITQSAFLAAGIFLVVVVIYLTLVFREWKMAVAALLALVQNLLLTAAVYLLIGFEVTPSTVIGFLTILGFALYDVVVVFDKVRENTRGITGNPNRTYGEAANLAVNQTLMRSINTAIVALLPVGGLLFIGAGLLGAGTLKDLGLVLFVGMLAAVYSSIFFATPVLVALKEAEPRFKLHKQRVLQRRAAGITERRATVRQKAPAAAAAETSAPDPALAGTAPRTGARPQPRKRTGAGSKPKQGGARSGGGGRKR
jgi:preprotein translocase subunit SecF